MSISVAALIRPAKGAMVLSAVLTALGAIVTLVPFVALHNMAAIWLDGQVRTGWTGKPWVWAVIAVLSLFVGQLLYLFGLGVTHEAEAKLRHRLRGNVVQALGSLPLGRVSQVPHGAIRKMVCDDTAAIHTLVAHVPGDVTNAVVSMVVGLGYLVWVDWRLALALFGTWAVAIMIIVSTTMRGYSDITERFGHAQTALAAATVEMLEGIKEIKNFQATDATRTRFNAARQQFSAISFDWVRRSGRAISLLGSLLRPATVFVTVALLAALFVAQDWSTLSATLPFFQQRRGNNSLLEVFEEEAAVEGFQRVGGEELKRTEEGLELVPESVGLFVEALDEVLVVGAQVFGFVVLVFDQPLQAFPHRSELLRVRDDLLVQVGLRRFVILVKLDRPVRRKQVQLGVERVVVLPLADPANPCSVGGGCF